MIGNIFNIHPTFCTAHIDSVVDCVCLAILCFVKAVAAERKVGFYNIPYNLREGLGRQNNSHVILGGLAPTVVVLQSVLSVLVCLT